MCEMLISGNFPSRVIYIRECTDSVRQGEAPRPLSRSQQEMFSSSLTRGGVFCFILRRFGGSDLPKHWACAEHCVYFNISVVGRERSKEARESLAGWSLGVQWAEASVAFAPRCPWCWMGAEHHPAVRQCLQWSLQWCPQLLTAQMTG